MIERRVTSTEVEVRSKGRVPTVEGYAAVFDAPYDMGGWSESVARGAFRKTLQEADVRCLFNHEPDHVLGRNKSGTLELANDSRGLHYRCTLPDTAFARDLYTLIERGDISQSSFAFATIKDTWTQDGGRDGVPLRTLRECRLYDVSIVTFPANEATTVDVARAARSLARFMPTRPEDEIRAALERGDLAPLWAPRGPLERLRRRPVFVPPTF